MEKLNLFKGLFAASVSILLTLSLAACDPKSKSKDDSPNGKQRISVVSEKVSECEAKLRKEMLEGATQLEPVGDLRTEIDSLNQAIPQEKATESKYQVTMAGAITGSLGHSLKWTSKERVLEVGSTLSRTVEGEAGILRLNKKFELMIRGKKNDQIEQNFLIKEDCSSQLTSTSREVVEKGLSGAFKFRTLSLYVDGGRREDQRSFHVTTGKSFIGIDEEFEFEEKNQNLMIYNSQFGLAEVETQPTGKVIKLHEFGRDFIFSEVKFIFRSKGRVLFQGRVGGNPKTGDRYLEIKKGFANWTISKEIWEQARLGQTNSTSGLIQSNLSKDYLRSENRLVLESETEPAYENFKAYWTIEKKGSNRFLLTENEQETVQSKTTQKDLESNGTIQTNLPEIQRIASEIRAKTQNRHEQIQAVLNYLKENYEYDYEMLKTGAIRPLTTQEALDRKKGVCQHYAVLFAALTRALKIPSRIVIGFLLSNPSSPGMHAWNEVEIEANRWKVIEPQTPGSLARSYTRFYLPVTRGLVFEDMELVKADYMATLVNLDWSLHPVSKP